MPEFYSADQLVGATLYARTRVPLKRFPLDTEPVMSEVMPGRIVGVVHSYLNPSASRANVYWQFKDSNGQYYYAEHKQGRFSESALEDQGVLSVQDELDAAAPPETLQETIKKMLLGAVGIWVGASILKEMIRANAVRRYRRNRYLDIF